MIEFKANSVQNDIIKLIHSLSYIDKLSGKWNALQILNYMKTFRPINLQIKLVI